MERTIREKHVTPLAGVWVEILLSGQDSLLRSVTPLAGVWVEMIKSSSASGSRAVTPRAGVWVEIRCLTHPRLLTNSHSPCGSVG